jgi:periplasmic divalent cation tolerance protein
MMQDGGGTTIVYTTMPDVAAAEGLAATLVEERLAACVNILPGMVSFYTWNGKLERTQEIACLIKTSRTKAPLVTDRLSQLHPYETPAVLTFDADTVAPAFAHWVAKQTGS